MRLSERTATGAPAAKPRRVLALETSGRAASALVGVDGAPAARGGLTAEQPTTALLVPLIQRLCGEAGCAMRDLDAVCFSCGPGSFSGLRLAATAARMLRWATGCRVVAVPTLEVIAYGATDSAGRVAALIDAKKGQVYAALYERDANGATRALEAAALVEPVAWLASVPRPFVIAGPGVAVHRAACEASGMQIVSSERHVPDVAGVLVLGERRLAAGCDCREDDITPIYIRPPEAEVAYESNRAAARARREH